MFITHGLKRAGLSFVVVSALLAGCDDENDSSSDDPSQTEQEEDTGGTSTPRAGRSGGSAGTAAAGRGTAGTVARAGSGGRAASAGQGSGGRRSDPGPGDDGDDEPGRGGRGGRVSIPSGGAGGTGGAPDDADDAGVGTISLNDGQIAEITSVVNMGEITLGTLALTRAQQPATRDYAQSMVTMHEAAQERQSAIATALGLTPSPSSVSAQLTDAAVRARNQLEAATEAEFDVLYVRSQIELHDSVLTTIDEQVLPNVTEDQLRQELLVARAEVTGHLSAAQALLVNLEGVDGADAGVP